MKRVVGTEIDLDQFQYYGHERRKTKANVDGQDVETEYRIDVYKDFDGGEYVVKSGSVFKVNADDGNMKYLGKLEPEKEKQDGISEVSSV